MASIDTSMLDEMGFSKAKITKALTSTGNTSVEAAMEWLITHADDLDEDSCTAEKSEEKSATIEDAAGQEQVTPDGEASSASSSTEPQVAKSLKCDECGKLFKAQLEVEFHAGKTGHSSFSESTEEKRPLTEEEKQEQLRKVEEKLKQKRREREEQEKKDALERERIRIKSGKEMIEAKKRLEEQEMKKLVDQRKREKIEEQEARQRIRAKIEQDKIARRAKFGMTDPGGSSSETASAPTPQPPPVQTAPPKDYTQTKLNIRLTNGKVLSQTFGAKEELSAVRLYVELNRTDSPEPFTLMTNFPKRVFTEEDYGKPLEALGLVPSAVIIVSRIAG